MDTSTVELTDLDKLLLQVLQRSVPLVRRPFRDIATELGASEQQVIARVAELSQSDGVIREIAGIFDAPLLGYRSMLSAMKVPPERLDEAGEIVAAHPGVSHCYSRPATYNLWFTLLCPPESALGLEGTARLLAKLCLQHASPPTARRGMAPEVDAVSRASRPRDDVLLLPVLRRYKLRVDIPLDDQAVESAAEGADLAGGAEGHSDEPRRFPELPRKSLQPTERQVAAIRALQQPLPALASPFDGLAAAQHLNADELLVIAADLLGAGVLRRYSAVLRHRSAGAVHNVLAAWQVSEDQADAFGRQAATLRQISHCYLRPAAADWPYTLYTMIHGRGEAEVRQVIDALAQLGHPHAELPTLKEYKKAKVRLFSDAFAQWEEGHT